VKAELVTQNI